MGTLARIDHAIDTLLQRGFAATANPWRHLGALTTWALAITVVSGIVTYALYDTSIDGAYQSGLRLQNDPTGLGAVLRGLHRYGADAFMVLMALHLVREFMRGHYRGARWFSWLTGVPLIWLGWIAGLTGLWLLWDARSLQSVMATAEWLQALPLVGDGVVRNFLVEDALNDRFFSLIMFLHIGVPLFLMGFLWTHLQRLRLPNLWPARDAALGLAALFVVLGLYAPAKSLGLADPHFMPAQLSIDWFFLFPHALANAISGEWTWGLAGALTLLIGALPWIGKREVRAPQPAVVDLSNCNGCSRCAVDCPFGAITMSPRSDGRKHPREAVVDPDLCTSCGICVGACPSSTPFRRIEELVSGIELPDQPIGQLRTALRDGLKQRAASDVVLVCTCRFGAAKVSADSLLPIELECLGMLPPSFIDFALREGVAGVVLAGCGDCNCEYRLGERWTAERLEGLREPHLRRIVPRERLIVLSENERANADTIRAAAHTLLKSSTETIEGDRS
jgi:quinol-cytochrome oxidoreductase complex cytochrome b subunit/coenzyme F420-reducing hydrogenase delta subunit